MMEFFRFMIQVFHGWRRKFGVVSLVMACLFAAGWVRSQMFKDIITISRLPEDEGVINFQNGQLELNYCWNTEDARPGRVDFKWHTITLNEPNRLEHAGSSFPQLMGFSYEEDSCFFQFGDLESQLWRFRELKIPYWSITAPLTLLSAFLLLTKPRKSNQKKISKRTSSEGTD